jgi:hypothetical protein
MIRAGGEGSHDAGSPAESPPRARTCGHDLREWQINTPRGVLVVGIARHGRRQRLDPGGEVRPREPLRQQVLDLGLAPVGRGGQELLGVLRGEMGRQQDHRAQVQAPLRHGRQDGREPPGGARRVDALEGPLLGEPQLAHAVRIHRRIRRRQVELASIDLGDVSEDLGGGGAIPGDQHSQITKQGLIAEM